MFRKLLLYFALLLWFVVPVQAQLTIMLPDMEVKQGEKIELEVRTVDGFDVIIGAQFSIQWNPDILQFVRIKEVNLSGFDVSSTQNVNTNEASEGRIGIRWDDPTLEGNTLADSAVLMSVELNVIGDPNDQDSLKFSGDPIAIEFGNYDVGPFDSIGLQHGYVTVMDVQTSTRILEAGNLRLLPNQPNPFFDQTQLNFELIKGEQISLRVYDLQGRVLWQQSEYRAAGTHRVLLPGADLPASGTYWLELQAGEHQLRQQLIHLK